MKKNWFVIIGIVLVLLVSAACSKSTLEEQAQQVIAGGGDLPEVKVTALAPTPADVLNKLDVLIEPGGGGYIVNISANDDLSELTELFLAINYDATFNHAYNLDTSGADQAQVLGLAVEGHAGTIEAGLVAVGDAEGPSPAGDLTDVDPVEGGDELPQPEPDGGDDDDMYPDDPEPWPGWAAGDPLVAFTLLPGADTRAASSVNTNNRGRARNLSLVKGDDDRWTLSWDYTNPGDNNQDGLVGVTDLTQIGQNYLTRITDAWGNPLRHIDSNNDGEINASDITAIGQNYEAEVFQYEIELWDEEAGDYITVGTLPLGEQNAQANQTVRFSYTFGPQYVERGWYRVAALTRNLERGTPSEEISEMGRRLAATQVGQGKKVTVTVYAAQLPYAIAHLNSLRITYPSSFIYVRESANAGSQGGLRSQPDGIWASFCQALLFPDDYFFRETDLGSGRMSCDFNVTSLVRDLPGAPVGGGDLINFQLESTGNDPLVLEFVDQSSDEVKRTYYTDSNEQEHFFGNAIGFRIN
ncbi:hypothetical protein JW859_00075 [bacterium]|nr:hypothetical protein [bacterium]